MIGKKMMKLHTYSGKGEMIHKKQEAYQGVSAKKIIEIG